MIGRRWHHIARQVESLEAAVSEMSERDFQLRRFVSSHPMFHYNPVSPSKPLAYQASHSANSDWICGSAALKINVFWAINLV